MHDNSLHQRLKTEPPITTGLVFTPPAWPCLRTPHFPGLRSSFHRPATCRRLQRPWQGLVS